MFRVIHYFFFWIFPAFILADPLQFQIKGEAAILINADSGYVLFEHKAHIPCYPASTTKLATALYALQHLKENELEIPIAAEEQALVSISQEAKRKAKTPLPSYWLEPDGMHIGIKKGEILQLKDLLKGMLISSGNDAANVIAHALGPSIPTFMQNLNIFLSKLGCQQTHFCNPHGLHDPSHVSTAYDLALIAQAALQYPLLCEIVSQTRFVRPTTNKQKTTTYLQTNRLLRPGKLHYSKAIGIKTGYHAKAKKTFIGAAQHEGRTLIVVLLGYSDRETLYMDAIQLFEQAFNQPKARRIFLPAGEQSFKKEIFSSPTPLYTYLEEPLYLEYYAAEEPHVSCVLCWKALQLPIMQDQEVGEVRLLDAKQQILHKVPLLAKQEVTHHFFYRWSRFLVAHSLIISMGGIALFVCIYLFVARKK
jgi:D-alanyl-D-alanine carboxypeptidase (penicillin-binding protein 5/6)